MRTTLTLDEDVVRLLADEAHRTQRPFKHVVNDAIRRGLVKKRTREILEDLGKDLLERAAKMPLKPGKT